MVKVLWKTVMGIQFHGTFHGFCTGRGTGTASLEAKLLQKLTAMREDILYEIF